MKALRVQKEGDEASLQEIPAPHPASENMVIIDTRYSSLNYKDALAVTGKGKILKRFPLTPGIDAAGVVRSSNDKNFKPGDAVLVTGCGTGEERDGGYADQMEAPGSAVIPLPKGMSLENSMFFGTAGFTAALAVQRLLQNGQTPDKGALLVTGATGGVGQFSIALLNHLGFEVWALTGKKDLHEEHLKKLGASQVFTQDELELTTKPLGRVRFGGVIDNLGGEILAQAVSHTQLWGNVASIGLAADYKFNSTVMPFILRGVSLLGISSNNCPRTLREEIWQLLSSEWSTKSFDLIPKEIIALEDVLQKSKDMLARKTSGRTLVQIGKHK